LLEGAGDKLRKVALAAACDTLSHFPGYEKRGEVNRVDHVRIPEFACPELALAHPQAERLTGDAHDADRLGRTNVGLAGGELLDDGGR
jgi:hypothetical protein